MVLSEKTSCAANCSAPPRGRAKSAGLTLRLAATGAVNVKVVDPLIAPELAVMTAVPAPMSVMKPGLELEPKTATAELDVFHETESVMFCVL